MLRYLPFLLVLALWIYTFIDCLNTPEQEVRGLPKLAWVIVILLFGEVLLGPVAWLVAGRPRAAARQRAHGRDGGGARWVAPDDNPEFLRSLDKDQDRGRDKDGDGGAQGGPPPAR
ncbi:PLD nuclease N-terminal domain-containing protein [Streptomyces gamaensis]|uniref:PLD nuclease N-terminal domain-containing protein n=1 Tax=Streptomyces gamaensis TaxID=1763542 RepID=A0ABW0YZC3_9ACTN